MPEISFVGKNMMNELGSRLHTAENKISEKKKYHRNYPKGITKNQKDVKHERVKDHQNKKS